MEQIMNPAGINTPQTSLGGISQKHCKPRSQNCTKDLSLWST